MSVRRAAAFYFAVQGIAVVVWWAWLFFVPSSRAYFQTNGTTEAALLAFWLPDLLLVACGSFVAAYFCLRGNDNNDARIAAALWLVCGAVGYATLYCLASALLTDSAWLSVALMLPAMLLSVSSTLAVSPLGTASFRQARAAGRAWNLTKTTTQIVIFWGTTLFLFPYLITQLESKIGVARVASPSLKIFAALLFVSCSALGLWSGFTMTVRGEGTPLPVDSPRRLVIGGAYACVRNPMAIAGLGQGFAVGLWLGSVFVLLYVLIGLLIWQFLTRPLEEEDMRRLFGAEYEHYTSRVRCWFPHRKPYKAE